MPATTCRVCLLIRALIGNNRGNSCKKTIPKYRMMLFRTWDLYRLPRCTWQRSYTDSSLLLLQIVALNPCLLSGFVTVQGCIKSGEEANKVDSSYVTVESRPEENTCKSPLDGPAASFPHTSKTQASAQRNRRSSKPHKLSR